MDTAAIYPLQEQQSEGAGARAGWRLETFSVVFDAIVIWDALSFLAASALVRIFHSDHGLLQISLIASLFAPVVLWENRSPLSFGTISLRRRVKRLLTKSILASLIVLIVAVVTKSHEQLSPAWAAVWLVTALALVAGGRVLLLVALRHLAARGAVAERVAVLGEGEAAGWLRTILARARPYGLKTVAPFHPVSPATLDHAIDRLLAQGRAGQVDRVILALQTAPAALRHAVHRLKALEIEVTSLYPAFSAASDLCSTEIAGVPLYVLSRRPHRRWGVLGKALFDRALGLCFALALSPVLALVALAVWFDGPGPVLFRQRRHGLNGTEFDVFKFRTMRWQGRAAGDGAVQTCRQDRRITRVGAVLRRTSLDELPQLFNVLGGTMSLVGPRPHPVSMRTEQRLGDDIIAEYAHRHRVKPGITGWAQVNGLRGATDTAEKLRRRVEHDIYYIENWSLSFDLRILAQTAISVLFHRDNAF